MEVRVRVPTLADRLLHVIPGAGVLARRVAARDRRVHADHGAKIVCVIERQVGREVTANRTAHVHGPLGLERLRNGHDGVHHELGREPILLLPPADRRWRHRLTVVWQVVRDHAEALLKLLVLQHVPPLAAVRTGRVLQDDGNALACFFVVHAILHSLNLHVRVATDGGVELAVDVFHHRGRLVVGAVGFADQGDQPEDRAAVWHHLSHAIALDLQAARDEAARPGGGRTRDPDIRIPRRRGRRDVGHPPRLHDDAVRPIVDFELESCVPVARFQQEFAVCVRTIPKCGGVQPTRAPRLCVGCGGQGR